MTFKRKIENNRCLRRVRDMHRLIVTTVGILWKWYRKDLGTVKRKTVNVLLVFTVITVITTMVSALAALLIYIFDNDYIAALMVIMVWIAFIMLQILMVKT